MFAFRDTSHLLPSELNDYVRDLEGEIRSLEAANAKLSTPDIFASPDLDDQEFSSEADLLAAMELGDVIKAYKFKKLGETFKVKISPERIDDHDDRFKAEHSRMLHGL